MRNAKLAVLFKEFPWLSQLPDLPSLFKVVSIVKVEKLDAETVGKRWVGSITTNDDSYYIDAFHFDADGLMLPVNNRPIGLRDPLWKVLWKKLRNQAVNSRDSFRLDEILMHHPERNQIRFIVCGGHDLTHYGQTQFYLYKVPKDKTVSDLLTELTQSREDEERVQQQKAEEEFQSEMSIIDD